MAKVILLDSPSWKLFRPDLHLHLGILYLAGSLRAYGHDVKVLDCHTITSWDEVNQKLIVHHEKLEPCDVLGISATTANVNYGSELAEAWHSAGVKVLGGSHVSHIMDGPHQEFKNKKYFQGFDFVMTGECEESFVKFCNYWDDILTLDGDNIPGLINFDHNSGGIRRSKQEGVLPDVKKLAPPAFDLWKSGFAKGALSSSSKTGKQIDANNLLSASLYTARGCPYGCTFCADARTVLREETTDQIEHECKQLESLGVRALRIQDDTMTIKSQRCKDMADVLYKYGMTWRGCTRVNLRDETLFSYLASHGCTELGFGIEHGSGKMLKLMNKGTTPEANELGIKLCQKSGMVARAFLMLGFPGETKETIQEMKDWVDKVRPDACVLSLFQPYPGSDVWNHPEKYNVKIKPDAFERMWQLGADTDPESLVLDLPTISRHDLFDARQDLIQWLNKNIGSLDRTRIDGNVGTFTNEACINL